jgi:hypothetical protein
MHRTFIRTISVEYTLTSEADNSDSGQGLANLLTLQEWFESIRYRLISDEIAEKPE